MIQDIKPHILKNGYKNVSAKENDVCLFYGNGEILLKRNGGKISFPVLSESGISSEDAFFIFEKDGKNVFLSLKEISAFGCYTYEKMNCLRDAEPREEAYSGVVGYHLYCWYRDNIYCGRCKTPLVRDKKERMLYCPECKNMIFPKICPAVIVCVRNGNKILITKYAGRDYTRYALIAGFCEIGETAEETVSREVFEEVGIKVKNIEYYKSQPWGFTGGLLMGFFCEADGDTEITMDENELSVAEWADFERLKDMDDGVSLTCEMMRVAYERQKKE